MGDIRNIQKTGNMFYVYLPTSWCKKFNISSDSQVQVEMTSEGKLMISSSMEDKKPKHIELNVDETDTHILNKIIVACYLSPASSFKINLKTPLDQTKLLDQKRLVSIELVEVEGNSITCKSGITATDPQHMLKTIISKIRNMLIVMTTQYNKELIERYEEEIDRNRTLINKSILSSLTFRSPMKTKIIDLFYISHMTRDIERIADHLIKIDRKEVEFFKKVLDMITMLKDIMKSIEKPQSFNYNYAIEFSKGIQALSVQLKTLKDYEKHRVVGYLMSMSEILMDWAIMNETER